MSEDTFNNEPLFSPEVHNAFEHSSVPLAIYYVKNGRFQTYLVSDAFCYIYGESHENLVARLNSPDPFINIPDDEEEKLWNIVRNFSMHDSPFNAMFHEYVPARDRTITIHATGTHEYTPDGRRYSIVTYEEFTEENLQFLYNDEKSEEISILDGLSMDCLSIWLVDAETRHVKLIRNKLGDNKISQGIMRSFKKLGSYQNGIEYYINSFVYPDDRERVRQSLSFDTFTAYVKQNGIFTLKFRQQFKDNPILYLQMTISHGGEKGAGNYIIAVRDVTNTVKEEIAEQKKLQEALDKAEAASRAKSTFLFNMSHDIRTPLNAIIGFTELSEKYSTDIQKQIEYRSKIKITSHQLLDILNNILEMARIESGKYVVENQLTNCDEFFKSWTSMFLRDATDKSITITATNNIKHNYIYFDQVHVTEILLNILSNAIKYTRPGGFINIIANEYPGETEDDCIIEVTVEDTGIGISKDFLSHIYDDFERERTTLTSSISGTGLGLSIVKRLVELMNGTINIESEMGKGTKVTVRIPHKIGEEPQMPAPENYEDLSQFFYGKHVLLAEDNDLNAEIAVELLTDVGFVVDRASDGIKCVDLIKNNPAGTYDLILMDIQMPNMDGYKATHYIRNLPDEKLAHIPIIAMTANAFKQDVENAINAGMNAHIAKPLDVHEMLKTIYDVLIN